MKNLRALSPAMLASLGSLLCALPCAPAAAQDQRWSVDLFTQGGAEDPQWRVNTEGPPRQLICVLSWRYNRANLLYLGELPGQGFNAVFQTDDVLVARDETIELTATIDGRPFEALGRTRTRPRQIDGNMVFQSALIVPLPQSILDALAQGTTMQLSADGQTGPAMALGESSAAVARYRECEADPSAFAQQAGGAALQVQILPPPVPLADRAPPPPRVIESPPRTMARGSVPMEVAQWPQAIQQNYPAQAIRERLEGVVGVQMKVTPEGRAADCRVTQSSGHAILDAAACANMERFARFNPALDADGEPIIGYYSTIITYRLPQATPPPPATSVDVQ